MVLICISYSTGRDDNGRRRVVIIEILYCSKKRMVGEGVNRQPVKLLRRMRRVGGRMAKRDGEGRLGVSRLG